MANPRIEVELGAVTSAFTKSLKNAQERMSEFASNLKNAASQGLDNLGKSLNELSKKLDSFGKKSTELGKSFSLFVTAPILALGTAAVKTASDTEESFSKFGVVFRDVAKSAEESFKILRNEYGLSSLEAKTLLGSTGDLLTGFGFSQESALELSTEVQKLAVDLASFTNFSGGAAGASDALTKALLGERESVKALGIAILEEDVKKQIAINTSKGLTFETERQAAAYATLELATAQSANAIGDYNRTSDSFANQSRLLGARLSDLSSELGEVLLPLMTKLVTFITGLVNRFTELDSTTKTVIVVVAGLAAAVGPLLLGIGGIIAIIPTFTAGLAALKVAMTAALGPIGILAAAFVGLAFYVVNNFDEIKIASKLLLLDTISFAQNFVKAIDTLVSSIPGFKSVTTAAFGSLQVLGQNVAKSLKENLAEKSAKSFEDLKDSAQESINGIKTSFEENAKSLGLIAGISEQIKNLNESRDLAKDQAEINLIDGKITKLKEQLSLIDAISKRANTQVSTGIDTSGLQRPSIDTSVNATQNISGVNFKGYLDQIKKVKEQVKKEQDEILEDSKQWNESISNTISAGLSDAFSGIGNAIGEALATGGNVIKAVGQSIIGSLSKFLGNMGKLLIEYGTLAVIKGKLDLAILTGGPVAIGAGIAAIAVGIALTAASSALGNLAGSGGGSSVGSSVASQSFSGGGVGGLGGGVRDLTGELVVRGTDLVYVLGQSNNKIAKG
jgi:hypothetical protein